MRASTSWLLLVLFAFTACAPQLRRARRGVAEPASDRELEAAYRLRTRSCSGSWGLLLPGLGQVCHGATRQGVIMMSFAAAELGTTIAVASRDPRGIEHPAALFSFVAYQDLWIYGVVETSRDARLAGREPLTPQDSFDELLLAPINPRVLARPSVWAGILGTVALGVAASLLVDEDWGDGFGDDVNWFGAMLDARVGYPLAGATFAGLFTHVAIAEESLFRGNLQSRLALRYGETGGWIWASLLFGAVHAPNAWLLPEEDRKSYLLYGVPFITAIGSYMGLAYRWNGYSLAPPVAIHFWYNFLISAIFFAVDPAASPISAGITVPI